MQNTFIRFLYKKTEFFHKSDLYIELLQFLKTYYFYLNTISYSLIILNLGLN